jgi:hypothetical protein
MNHLSWLAACFAMAFLVWIVATIQSDPIVQQTYNAIPVQVTLRDGYLLTESPRSTTVRVIVRGQQSAVNLLTAEDITVRADLTQVQGGSAVVPLVVSVARRGIYNVDTQPAQMTLTTELLVTEQKSIEVAIEDLPPVDYAYESPQPNVLQVAVSGAASEVAKVSAIRAQIDLANQRNPVELEATLIAIDAGGNRVTNVTIEPRTAQISVNIYARDDVRQLAIRPAIQLDTLAEGYVLNSIGYEPQVIYVSGNASQLAALGATIDTDDINLTGQTSNFTTEVGVQLPQGIVILDETSTVTVTLGISGQTSAKQIDSIPIEIIGLPTGYTATLTPDNVSVVLSGPIQIIEGISNLDVRAIIDLNSIPMGNNEVVPQIVIQQGQTSVDTTVLPASVSVNITPPTVTPEGTESP